MVNPENTDTFVFWLFNHRCVGIDGLCYQWTNTINEIRPRSSGDDPMNWKNRVPMCGKCHDKYHDMGVSDDAILKLQERRKAQLILLRREEYI